MEDKKNIYNELREIGFSEKFAKKGSEIAYSKIFKNKVKNVRGIRISYTIKNFYNEKISIGKARKQIRNMVNGKCLIDKLN